MPIVHDNNSSSPVYSWLGSALAAQIVNPANVNGAWNHPPDALVGSDLTISSDGKTITFVTTGLYVVVIFVSSVGTSPGNLTVSPLVTSFATNYYNVAPTAITVPATDTFATEQVTYPPAKMTAGDTMVVNFEANGATITARADTAIWVTKIA